MDFNLDSSPKKEVKEVSLSNGEGFELLIEKEEDREDVRVWQKIYGETVFVMTIDRHSLADLIYALEDML
tara:strand:+ start:209 stop:418 length:210 start_codon:yes stop_codon:yes gene_type:complete